MQKLTKPTYQIYYINLDRSPNRKKLMEKEFEKCGIDDYVRIPAVDAKDLKGNEYKVENKYKKELLTGEIACYLSHIKTLKTFMASGDDFAVILEDDVVLENDFKSLVEKSMANYISLPKNHQWDVLKLKNGKRRNIPVSNMNGGYFVGACGASIPISAMGAIWIRGGGVNSLKTL